MPNGAQHLGAELGQLIFGKPDDKAYYQGQQAGSLVRDHLDTARKARAAAMIDEDRLGARQHITPQAMTTAGYAPGQAELLGNLLRSNTNVDLRDLGTLQSPVAGQAMTDARDALKGGDTGLGNLMLALAQGKPLETTTINQGQAYNKYGDSGQAVDLTALGQAMVGEKNAMAADHHASAGEHTAHADLYRTQDAAGGFNPHSGRGAGTITYPNAPDATVYLGDPKNAQAFTAWRSQHPEYSNGNEAWIAYRGQRPIGAPTGEPAAGDGPAPVYDAPGSVDLAKLGEALVNSGAPATVAPAAAPARKIVRTGTKDGRKVVQYDDGTIDYAD